jgi:hypothetical protein
LKASRILPGDVLLSIVGTVGALSLVPADSPEMTGSCKIATLRPKGHVVRPEYLAAFLASRYGQNQIERLTRGAVQTGLLLADMKHIRIVRLGELEDRIADEVAAAYSQLRGARAQIDHSREWLPRQLRFEPRMFSGPSYGARPVAGLLRENRWDAEYFSPAYAEHRTAVEALPAVERLQPTQSVLKTLTNGHTPRYHDLTKGEVRFITAENIVDFTVDYGTSKRITLAQHSGELARTALSDGDILFNIKGRVGDCAPVAELPDEPVNVNQDVAVLTLKDDTHPYFFAGWFNSRLGRAFVEQAVTGAINPFVGLQTLRRLPFPVVAAGLQARLGDELRGIVESARVEESAAKRRLQSALEDVESRIAALASSRAAVAP